GQAGAGPGPPRAAALQSGRAWMAGSSPAMTTVGGAGEAGSRHGAPTIRPRFPRLDHALAVLTEVPAALLVVVEICVLFAGVVARYVFNRPLVWSDELASALFLWLAMIGAVIALRRGEHMRLTAIVKYAGHRTQSFLETLAAIIVALFVLMILLPARSYIEGQW